MKTKKILSYLLIAILSFSLVSCVDKSNNGNDGGNTNGGKVSVVKEEAFTTMPEQQLATDYLKEYLTGGDELYQEGMKFFNLYWKDEVDQEFMDKYNLKYEKDKVYNLIDAYNDNNKLYTIAINSNMHGLNCDLTSVITFANKGLMPMVQNYLSDIWEDNKDGEYKLSPEFEKLNPKKHVQKYLKENKIELIEIIYPTKANGLEQISGSTVMNVPVVFKGKQDGKEFSKTINLDFYFVVNNDLRTGNPEDTSPNNFEIMGVNISSDTKELNGYNYHFNYENALKDFGIK